MSKSSKKIIEFDDSFYKLAKEVTAVIDRNRDPKDKTLDSTEIQKKQVEELLDAERKFKETILKYRQSTEVYKKFLQKICLVNKNILSARPYFRENAVSFSKKVTPAIKNSDIELLKTFDINYQLIKFIRDSWLGPENKENPNGSKLPKRAEELFQRVHRAREVLIENNMPLAINRAKLFYRKTPKSHLSLMDMIGICGAGLVQGIDKYCGVYTPVFRSVCIGRMVGNLIDEYSETMLHFYPSDKRILYKAHTIRGRRGIEDLNELAAAINQSFKDDEAEGKSVPKNEVTVGELSTLMQAASAVSADATTPNSDTFGDPSGDQNYGVYSYTADETVDLEGDMIAREDMAEMLAYASKLPLLHRKILRLKGIKL